MNLCLLLFLLTSSIKPLYDICTQLLESRSHETVNWMSSCRSKIDAKLFYRDQISMLIVTINLLMWIWFLLRCSYNNSLKSCCFSAGNVSSTVIKEDLGMESKRFLLAKLSIIFIQKRREKQSHRVTEARFHLTVFLGSTHAIRMAASIASREGLQRILELEVQLLVSGKPVRWACGEAVMQSRGSGGGLRVSKHMMPSKQSSTPNLLRTRVAWALSAFVKIWKHQLKKEGAS